MTTPSGGPETFPDELQRLAEGLRRLPARRWRGWREPVRDVVQRWADVCADLEGEPRRVVPLLEGDPSLADQLAVVGDDLARAAAAAPGGAAALAAARADLERLRAG